MKIEWYREPPPKNQSGMWFFVRESKRHKYYCTRLIYDRGEWWTDFPTGNVGFEKVGEEHADSFMRWRTNPIKNPPEKS